MPQTLSILVTRDRFLADRTLGVVYLDLPEDGAGFLPFGYSCEDVDRHVEADPSRKVDGATAIPIGTYCVHLYDSPKHGADTPELLNVPGFQHIQIHSGNGPQDTEGCLLFGLDRTDTEVVRSQLASKWIRGEIQEVLKAGGVVTVEIKRV